MDDLAFSHVFSSGKRYSMGWWKDDKVRHRKKRFGVDVGYPDGGGSGNGNCDTHDSTTEQKIQG